MTTGRVEAFSDGVIAVIITIMVLELEIPNTSDWQAIVALLPKFISYILSFLYVGLYWNNHHHLLYRTSKINGSIMWSNLFFLFSLSLIPFSTGWMGDHHFAKNTIILYGLMLILTAVSYTVLSNNILKSEGKDSDFAKAIKGSFKEKWSIVLYIAGIVAAFFYPYLSLVFYYFVALMWIVPDKRLANQ